MAALGARVALALAPLVALAPLAALLVVATMAPVLAQRAGWLGCLAGHYVCNVPTMHPSGLRCNPT